MSKPRSEAQRAADRNRTGRPPKTATEKQSRRAMVYLTPAEHDKLHSLAEEAGISLAALIMRPWREKDD
ncbi:MAG: ribbon-helix-helix domain-containing protein [Candidatus Latescibacterota bacterium]